MLVRPWFSTELMQTLCRVLRYNIDGECSCQADDLLKYVQWGTNRNSPYPTSGIICRQNRPLALLIPGELRNKFGRPKGETTVVIEPIGPKDHEVLKSIREKLGFLESECVPEIKHGR